MQIGNDKNKRFFNKHLIKRTGFSIIEVLIFTLLSSIVLIGLCYATLLSIRNSQQSQNRTLSTRYIQQTQEWLRGQKEIDWVTFINSITVSTYCINTMPESISEISGYLGECDDDDYSLSNYFKRELTVTSVSQDQKEVSYKVQVYWREGPNIATSQVSSLLAQWE